MEPTNELFEKHQDAFYKFANILKRSAGMELEDALSELRLSVCEALPKYNENKSGVLTFIYYVMYNKTRSEVSKRNKRNRLDIDFINTTIDQYYPPNQEKKLIVFDEIIKHSNKVVQKIGDILLTYRIPCGKHAPFTNVYVHRILRSFGYSSEEIKTGFKELSKIVG